MNIHLATTDESIAACYPMMRELRPHIALDEFVARVRSQEISGYQLAALDDGEGVVAVAGFRTGENLAWGRHLYVDDLVTLDKQRCRGYGARLLSWLREFAAAEGCRQLHLDSGIQRQDAHRFYEREDMSKTGYHFVACL
jgi:GNAT superfamily N-acetyltransferase